MTTENTNQISFLDMSDEEASKLVLSQIEATSNPNDTPTDPVEPDTVVDPVVEDPNKVVDEDKPTVVDPTNDDENKNIDENKQKVVENSQVNVDNGKKLETVVDDATKSNGKTVDPTDKTSVDPKEPTDKVKSETNVGTINYEAEYNKLFEPLQANGKTIIIKSAEDARTLMQMGANYNKKMHALKPNLKVMKMLEVNGLLDEGKLNYLIDLDKKNPEAIKRLVKEAGINPMDIDTEAKTDYKPTNHEVSDSHIALDLVLDEIEHTPTYAKTITVVGKEWDDESKAVVIKQPQLLKVINDHVASGVYDLVMEEVEKERALGRLSGVSDLAAYELTGNAIYARGGFDSIAKKHEQQNTIQSNGTIQTIVPAAKANNEELVNKKKAVAPVKQNVKTAVPANFNPLSLSDDDFAKHVKEGLF